VQPERPCDFCKYIKAQACYPSQASCSLNEVTIDAVLIMSESLPIAPGNATET
jgi:hypothetical protein